MRLTEILATEFLALHRGEIHSNHYTSLYDILFSLIETHKPVNKTIKNQLGYIYNNTTSDLILSLPIAEELYFKYAKVDVVKRGNFNINYTTRTGLDKEISRNRLKLQLSKAKSQMFHIFSMVASKYNYDIPINLSGKGV